MMNYLIAQAVAFSKFVPDAIMIIPVTRELTSLLKAASVKVDPSIESLRPAMDIQFQGFLLSKGRWNMDESDSKKSFRALVLNELSDTEYETLAESSILNEDVLEELAEPFQLTIDVFQASACFRKADDLTIEYTTYSIPLNCMPLPGKVLASNPN